MLCETSAITKILITEKRNAKVVKVALERKDLLDRSYRMTSLDAQSLTDFEPTDGNFGEVNSSGGNDHTLEGVGSWSKYIAIPIHEQLNENIDKQTVNNEREENQLSDEIQSLIFGYARQSCPYSTAVLGNIKLRVKMSSSIGKGYGITKDMNLVQTILLDVIKQYHISKRENGGDDGTGGKNHFTDMMEKDVRKQSHITCPPKLEVMGDDRTLVIPFRALNSGIDPTFHKLIQDTISVSGCRDNEEEIFMAKLWEILARSHNSHRVVRRGEIDPNSKVRESGHSILWIEDDDKSSIILSKNGSSRGWITITEQGIKQSFDLTKVMFSRGNISEKIRFSKLVQENELVLDMYAGIGYYTLPALVHGKARHVFCCEWNPHAASFLRYNLKQNGVNDRSTVLEGDSRVTVLENNVLDHDFDRVSLGLLPSSEGGWKTAVKALSREKGGWLHIHGNVPSDERDEWSLWICQQLSGIHSNLYADDIKNRCMYNVICSHVEKVKSFAPKVDHFVADIFIGPIIPADLLKLQTGLDENGSCVGIISDGKFIRLDGEVPPPSCALGHGILDQKWMM